MEMLKKADDILEKAERWIVVLTGVVVCAIIFLNALMRYIIKADFYGNEEITLLFAFWLYFTGSSIAAKKNTHINADMISMFSKSAKVIDTFHLVRDIIGLVMAGIAFVWSCQYVWWSADMGAKSPVFKFPMVLSQIPIMISFFFWTLYMARDVIRSIRKMRYPSAAEEEG